MTLHTFRDRVRQSSPSWLQRGNAEKLLYSVGVLCDTLGDAVVAAVKHRFPGMYSFESLPVIGRERRIPRGRLESDETYAARLPLWLVDHSTRGGPYALLSQLHAYFAPANFPVDLVYYSGRRFRMDVDGVVTRDDIVWHPDGDAARWSRWWLFMYTDAYPDPTPDVLNDLRVVPRAWNAAHALGYIVLLPTGGELWNYPPGHTWNELGLWNTGAPSYVFPVDPEDQPQAVLLDDGDGGVLVFDGDGGYLLLG